MQGDVVDDDGNIVDKMNYTNTVYYCKLHPDLGNAFLGEIELHCREKEPDRHRTEIVRLLHLQTKPAETNHVKPESEPEKDNGGNS
jgi:hypothetical protein